MIHLVIYSSGKLKNSLEKTQRLHTNPHGNFKKSLEGEPFFCADCNDLIWK